MQLYSNTLTKLILNIDRELETLETNIISKDIEIQDLKQIISNLEKRECDRIDTETRNMFEWAFSYKIELDGLGVSDARLLNELRQLDKIEDMNKFLTQFDLNK
jgi:uncharacterized protein related to proFAR isomerase